MATVVTVGRVEYLKVAANGYGLVNIRIETPTGFNVPPVPPGPSNEILIIYGGQFMSGKYLYTPELSRALASGLRVRISHDDHSAFITQLIVDAPFEGSLV